MSVYARARSLGALSQKWLQKQYPYRKKTIRRLVSGSGFSELMAHAMLDALFSEYTERKLIQFLKSELGNPRVLDSFVFDPQNRRYIQAKGPSTIVHVLSSNIPTAAVSSFVLGLLVGSTNVGKLSSVDPGFLYIYLESLRKHDPKLSKHCLLVSPDKKSKIQKWFQRADLVLAYGSDETLSEIRKYLGPKTQFVGYGHRVSLSLHFAESLSRTKIKRIVSQTAQDVWQMDQRGCLSPSSICVQTGGEVAPAQFADRLGQELEKRADEKAGPKRSFEHWMESRRMKDRFVMLKIQGKKSNSWHVSGGCHAILVKGFRVLKDLEIELEKMKNNCQAVALSCAPSRRKALSQWLFKFGFNRITRPGKLQHPPITWHHDGMANLSSWIRWVDLEV